jgi:hypothetical protein
MIYWLLGGKLSRSASVFPCKPLVSSLPATCVMICAPTFYQGSRDGALPDLI